MTNCVGDHFYYDLLRHIGEAERYCQQEPVEIPEILHKVRTLMEIIINCDGDHFYYDLLRHIGEAERYW